MVWFGRGTGGQGGDPLFAVSRGLACDALSIHKFGRNDNLSTTIEDLWNTGGLYTWRTAAVTLEAISTSADDAAAGSGAQTIVVEGLDENFEPASETITMNGLSASVATTTTFIRTNRAYVLASGAYAATTIAGGHAGDIMIRGSGGGSNELCILRTGTGDAIDWVFGQTQVARYTVPAGRNAFLQSVSVNNESSKTADIVFWQRRDADTVEAPFTAKRVVLEFDGVSGDAAHFARFPMIYPPKTDLWLSARLTSGANGKVSADFELVTLPV